MNLAFITGSTGFVGRNLIEQLLAEGWRVTALYRSESKIEPLRQLDVQWVQGNITDATSLEKAIPQGVDAVFHVAGNTNVWSPRNAQQTRDNVNGTRNMVAAALKRKAKRLIHTSSFLAYGFHQETITEETPSTAAESGIHYFHTKRLAELEILQGIEQGLDAVIINPSNIMGPYDRHNWAQLFTLIHLGRLPGVPSGRGSFCHVREVARAHIAAYQEGRTGHNYLLGGVDATYLELVGRIGKMLNREVPTKATPSWLLRLLGRLSLWGSYVTRKEPDLTPEKAAIVTGTLFCSSEKAERELGYRKAPLETMLRDCHEWMSAEGLLPN
jgi:nucleoside-diphosphate-sugar epimerase